MPNLVHIKNVLRLCDDYAIFIKLKNDTKNVKKKGEKRFWYTTWKTATAERNHTSQEKDGVEVGS